MAGLFTPSLRFALSGENLSNNEMQDYAPKTTRAALAYSMLNGDLTLHDPVTGQNIEVTAFGQPNRVVFANMLPSKGAR
jgi:asparagine synthetase A